MKKSSWLLVFLLNVSVIVGCRSASEKESNTQDIQPITSSEFLRHIGSKNSFYTGMYNGLDITNEKFHRPVPGMSWVTVWVDGAWTNIVPSADGWHVRWHLALLNGKVVGTVGEINPKLQRQD